MVYINKYIILHRDNVQSCTFTLVIYIVDLLIHKNSFAVKNSAKCNSVT